MLMFNVAFSSFSNINQSACSALDGVLKSQSDFDWELYKRHREFSIRKKIIPMSTCPYWCPCNVCYGDEVDHFKIEVREACKDWCLVSSVCTVVTDTAHQASLSHRPTLVTIKFVFWRIWNLVHEKCISSSRTWTHDFYLTDYCPPRYPLAPRWIGGIW